MPINFYVCETHTRWPFHWWLFVIIIRFKRNFVLLSFKLLNKLSTQNFAHCSCDIVRLYHDMVIYTAGLILGFCPSNERRHYFVTMSLIGWAQTSNQPCITFHTLWQSWYGNIKFWTERYTHMSTYHESTRHLDTNYIQSSAVITWSNLSWYYIWRCNNSGRKWIRF